MYLFSVKDVKSGIFATPFPSENAETAARALQTSLLTAQDNLTRMYPEDFILYQIGTFDNETGWIEHVELMRIACCSELLQKFKEQEDGTVDKVVKLDRKKSK